MLLVFGEGRAAVATSPAWERLENKSGSPASSGRDGGSLVLGPISSVSLPSPCRSLAGGKDPSGGCSGHRALGERTGFGSQLRGVK